MLDASFTHWINGFAGIHPLLDVVVATFGSVAVPLMVLYTVFHWWLPTRDARQRHLALAAGATFLLGQAINQIVLLFVHRPRPYLAGVSHLLIPPSADWSFPSDHATAATGIALTFLLHGYFGRGASLMGVALLVCLARVWVGTHYVGDVLGGFVTALVAATFVKATFRPGTRFDTALTSLF